MHWPRLSRLTGAASGIGKAAVTSYALAGARTIYATDIAESGLQEVVDGVMHEHPEVKVIGVRMDVAKSEEVEATVRRIIGESGRLDWFVSWSLVFMSCELY
jgi:NAD(P)-dependent dehydrogenase (short-subunit alcohol dehydrogenase family)